MKPNRIHATRPLLLFFLLFCSQSGTAANELPAYDRVRALQPPKTVSDVELVDQYGEPFRLSELHGQVALVFFGFTHCPDVCPAALQRLAQLERSAGDQLDGIAYVMVSVDGERDTPAVLKSYLARVSPRFIGLTGAPADVKAMAREFSAAFFKGSAQATDGSYSVSHSPQVFVVDRSGMLRAEFYNASVDAMTGVTLALLEESGRGHEFASSGKRKGK